MLALAKLNLNLFNCEKIREAEFNFFTTLEFIHSFVKSTIQVYMSFILLAKQT